MNKVNGFTALELAVTLALAALITATVIVSLGSGKDKANAQVLEEQAKTVLMAGRSYYASQCHSDLNTGAVPSSVSYSFLLGSGYVVNDMPFPFEVNSVRVYLESRGALSKARLQISLANPDTGFAERIRNYTFSATGSGNLLVWETPLYPDGRNDFINMYHGTRC